MSDLERMEHELEAQRAVLSITQNQVNVLEQLLEGARLMLAQFEEYERELQAKIAAAPERN